MKQLQNNYTTPEQSKRLLELGVPADSADIGIIEDAMCGGIELLRVPYSQWCKGYENISTPCWSVGRLIEIELLCREEVEGKLPRLSFYLGDEPREGNLGAERLIDALVQYFEQSEYQYDFSKLEE